jgi:hypothetical protein
VADLIDLRHRRDVRYHCPVCERTLRLSAAGAVLFEQEEGPPTCGKCKVPLIKEQTDG